MPDLTYRRLGDLWRFSDGATLPVVAGGSDTGTTTTTSDTGDTSSTGSGTSDTGATGEKDWKAEAEKWQNLSRKHEERAKANASAASELEKVRQASMTEQEKAVAQAKADARAEALATVGQRLVDAEVRAQAAGRNVDVDALLEGLDRSRFLGDDGEPDAKKVTTWLDRVAPKRPGFPDLGQGARGGNGGTDMNSFLSRAIRDRRR